MPSASSKPDMTARMQLMMPMPRYMLLMSSSASASPGLADGGACEARMGTTRLSMPKTLLTSTRLAKTIDSVPKVRGTAVPAVHVGRIARDRVAGVVVDLDVVRIRRRHRQRVVARHDVAGDLAER